MNSEVKVILGIAGGIATGLLIGLFTAPEKGSETRKRVSEQSGQWKDSLAKLFKHSKNGDMREEESRSTNPAVI